MKGLINTGCKGPPIKCLCVRDRDKGEPDAEQTLISLEAGQLSPVPDYPCKTTRSDSSACLSLQACRPNDDVEREKGKQKTKQSEGATGCADKQEGSANKPANGAPVSAAPSPGDHRRALRRFLPFQPLNHSALEGLSGATGARPFHHNGHKTPANISKHAGPSH